ncbi:MAG: hypothetical protein V3V61_00160 [Gammaproteobacteria bacterium]
MAGIFEQWQSKKKSLEIEIGDNKEEHQYPASTYMMYRGMQAFEEGSRPGAFVGGVVGIVAGIEIGPLGAAIGAIVGAALFGVIAFALGALVGLIESAVRRAFDRDSNASWSFFENTAKSTPDDVEMDLLSKDAGPSC